jgi:uncharacterized protein YcbK (DUF882 family)
VAFSGLARTLLGSSALRPLATAGVAALFVFVASESLQTVVANGDTRTLSFHHIHTDERVTVTFKKNGRYDEGALKQLNQFLRDWRNDDVTNMDPHLFDLLWEVHRHLRANGPITIISAYRSPQTNAMLRARGRGVARFSQHMSGKAIDFYIPGVELSDIRETGMRLQRGGVGFYPTSGSPFVHIDTGGVRHWPRVSPEHLARIFPDGKTVHIASDGKQLRGFMLAKAEIEARGDRPGTVALASLGGNDEEEDSPRAAPRPRMASAPVATTPVTREAPAPAQKPVVVASAPNPAPAPAMPVARPNGLGDITASLREEEKPREQTQVMAYADPQDRPNVQFGPIPMTHQRLAMRYEPEVRLTPADQMRPQETPQVQAKPQPKPETVETASLAPTAIPNPRTTPQAPRAESTHVRQAYTPYADAARPPAKLIHARTVQDSAELHHPDLLSTRSMVEPVRTALRIQFGDSLMAPASVNFSGPAVVPLRVVAFDRGGGIMGGLASRQN